MRRYYKIIFLLFFIVVLFLVHSKKSFAQLSTSIDRSYACSGFTGTSIPPNGNYKTTAFGCVNGFSDPNDNCVGACGNPPGLCNGLSGPDCERKLGWFAADADRYGCFSRLKITNPITLKSAVVIVIDRGPACSQEQAHNAPIIDLSYTAAKYVGGTNGGNYEVAHVEKVSNTTPLGPVTAKPTPTPTKKPTPTPTKKPTPTPTKKPTPTPTKKPTPTPTKKPTPSPTKKPTSLPTQTSSEGCTVQPTQTQRNFGTFIVPFTVTQSGNYVVWTRMKAGSSTANSFYLQIDNNCPEIFGDSSSISTNSWTWISYLNNQTGSPYVTELSEGDHFFTIIGRESGVKIDRLLFSNIEIPCNPSGKNDMCLSSNSITSIPTPTTPINGQTRTLFLSVLLHGLGKSGDNANPQAYSFSNQNPIHKEREVTISAFNTDSQLISSATTTVTYNPQKGSFDGSVDLDNLEDEDDYILKIKMDGYLVKKYDNLYSTKAGSILPPVTLITGDVNSDNTLNILDYNLLLGCQDSSLYQCDEDTRVMSDITDNGHVDIVDLNLFFRELTVTSGD